MNDEFDKLERIIEREMAILGLLPPEQPSDACLRRVRSAVLAESGRARRQWRLPARSAMLGAAAALALVVGWSSVPVADVLDADASLRDWAAALEDSNTRLVNALHEGWARETVNGDVETELNDLLRSLDESLTRLQNL